MKITILTDKPTGNVQIAKKVWTEVKCIVLVGKLTMQLNCSFYSTNINNSKFSFN